MNRLVVLFVALVSLATYRMVDAQSLTGEVDVTAGASTERAGMGGVQARLFGPVASWRVLAETTFAGRTSPDGSDAFGSAYPYDGRVRPMEIYAEHDLWPRARLATVRIGRYRVPFGISGRSDYAYGGFTRAPLIRYGDNWALSNTFLDSGVDVLIGPSAFRIEGSAGVSSDEGDYRRAHGPSVAVRGQAYTGGVIAGVSYTRSRPSMVGDFVAGASRFGGLDARWMRGGVLLRAEWVAGRPFDGVATRGGYVDLVVHRAAMEALTFVVRAERLDYDAGPFSAYYRRVTVGGRYQLSRALGAQANLLHQPNGLVPGGRSTAVDASLTYTIRLRRP